MHFSKNFVAATAIFFSSALAAPASLGISTPLDPVLSTIPGTVSTFSSAVNAADGSLTSNLGAISNAVKATYDITAAATVNLAAIKSAVDNLVSGLTSNLATSAGSITSSSVSGLKSSLTQVENDLTAYGTALENAVIQVNQQIQANAKAIAAQATAQANSDLATAQKTLNQQLTYLTAAENNLKAQAAAILKSLNSAQTSLVSYAAGAGVTIAQLIAGGAASTDGSVVGLFNTLGAAITSFPTFTFTLPAYSV